MATNGWVIWRNAVRRVCCEEVCNSINVFVPPSSLILGDPTYDLVPHHAYSLTESNSVGWRAVLESDSVQVPPNAG